jgi:hypothetical protein
LLRFSSGHPEFERILCLDVDDFVFRVFAFLVFLFILVAFSAFFFTGLFGPSATAGT